MNKTEKENMIRNYKFRAWYKEELIKYTTVKSGDYVIRFESESEPHKHPLTYDFQTPFLDDGWTVEQYIGLEDKNGVEIYEGDIIKIIHKFQCREHKGKIIYDGLGFILEGLHMTHLDSPWDLNEAKDDSIITIVGNIHQMNEEKI